MDQRTVARLYFQSRSDDKVVVQIPGTNYQLHLKTTGTVEPTPQGRVRGVIRCSVWKVDFVSAGGAYIEPVYGRPRRVQGHVIGSLESGNSIIVDVQNQPIVADLPDRWQASEIAEGTKVGLDVYEGATFEAAPAAASV
ncbi:hypothetical protein HED60_00340 [Planctomycetales bacterium ZRK34]|nr:hypothetical protein HED60_00340 [Planctomycetales bacterium ZRK34]